jgi:signal transduction histidine kinase
MPFRVTARTILQLGAELISSDAVAFYELIKNSFDARSKRVEIDVVIALPFAAYTSALSRLSSQPIQDRHALTELKEAIKKALDNGSPGFHETTKAIDAAKDRETLKSLVQRCNYINIRDTGHGMSLQDLDDIYLTIGTPNKIREAEKARPDGPPILGEKGLGRLSTMRLGGLLRVEATTNADLYWNVLEVDWTDFAQSLDALIGEIPVAPHRGTKKPIPTVQGTTIRISALTSEWDRKKLEQLAESELARLNDPFIPDKRFRITLRFNDELIAVPPISNILFEHADAEMSAELKKNEDGDFELNGTMNYRLRDKVATIHIEEDHLLNLAGLQSHDQIERLGPFALRLYWFNRQRLRAIEGIGDLEQVRRLVDQWGGGLMLYRDGFRVHPYGGPSDDWLELDPTAFRAKGYKVNRKQIIGKVDISRRLNPFLLDQTNREGLRDDPEKQALVSVLQSILTSFRMFLDRVDTTLKEQERQSFDVLEERASETGQELRKTLATFSRKYPSERRLADAILDLSSQLTELIAQGKSIAASYEDRQSQLVHLAGIGLMVEVVAHELNRATQHALGTLSATDLQTAPTEIRTAFRSLESQLKTLQKRLRILDPLSTAGRQVKERFELVAWVREIMASHSAQFERHDIVVTIKVIPENGELWIRAVRGMIAQIIENLLSNAVYWLKREARVKSTFRPTITISIDTTKRRLSFADNGPGIESDRREEIFYPFVTTKPAREGKGLGLYISQEIAKYHGARLVLGDARSASHPNRLSTFVLELPENER